MRNEVGATICRRPDGSFALGPRATGTPTSVNVPVQCPPGTTLAGIWHTHPGGVPMPSATDVRSGVKVGAKTLCITVPETGETRCHNIVKNNRRR